MKKEDNKTICSVCFQFEEIRIMKETTVILNKTRSSSLMVENTHFRLEVPGFSSGSTTLLLCEFENHLFVLVLLLVKWGRHLCQAHTVSLCACLCFSLCVYIYVKIECVYVYEMALSLNCLLCVCQHLSLKPQKPHTAVYASTCW